MQTAQIETTQDEAPAEQLEVPEWVLDNLLRQTREWQLETHIIPAAIADQKEALKPLTDKRSDINDGLKENAEARAKAYESKANKSVIMDILKEEDQLKSNKAKIQGKIDAERDSLEATATLSEARKLVKVHKFKRYQGLETHFGDLETLGSEPLETEDEDVLEYDLDRSRKNIIARALSI